MGGVEYKKAIGTHAWTTMTFAVPKGALLFQAVVGLSDQVRGCEQASVGFAVAGIARGDVVGEPGCRFRDTAACCRGTGRESTRDHPGSDRGGRWPRLRPRKLGSGGLCDGEPRDWIGMSGPESTEVACITP